MAAAAERVTSTLTYHGECPFWDYRTSRLLWMDVLAGELHALTPSGTACLHTLPGRVATVVRRRASGGFVVALESSLVAANDDFAEFEPIAVLPTRGGIRTNDGTCDPLGGLAIGTMAYDETPYSGMVYRVTPQHEVVTLVNSVTISNGVQWSADGDRVFYIDTPTRRVDVFDFDWESGAWRNRRVHIQIPRKCGFPDGMAIDEEDGLWIAMWGSGMVHHYDASGRFAESVLVPGVSQVSACAFGGPGLQDLYITTSRVGLERGSEPDAGALFAVTTGSRGKILTEFAG
jgi:sugar lactone lactonase YvrE